MIKKNIDDIHSQYQALDKAEVIKSGDSTNLDSISNEVSKIYDWENEYFLNAEYRDQLPEPTRKNIELEFENASKLFEQIVNMRGSDIAQFARQKTYYVNNVKGYHKSLYDAFVRDYRGWKTEYSQADRLKELDSIFADAKKRQENIQAREEEIEKRADATAELAQDLGLSQLSKYFYQLVAGDNDWMTSKKKSRRNKAWRQFIIFFRGYQGAARIWLLLAIAAFFVAFLVADRQLLPFIKELTSVNAQGGGNISATLVYAILIAKSLILLVPIYAIRFCLKNYGSNKHLAADALHKAKSLQTLPTFLAIPRDDEAAIREVATTVARIVFTPTTSGFITQKGDYDNPDISINAPQVKT